MNTEDPTGCFERLGLTPEADARTIKRAYARELRRIDTHTELERFARLRQDYEQALAMATEGQAPTERMPDPVIEEVREQPEPLHEPEPRAEAAPEPAPEAQAPPLPDAISNGELLAQVAQLATFAPDDVPAAVLVLRRILDMEALASLSSRDAFEAALVHALYDRRFGACNGALLLAADEAFGWRVDGARHLARMGFAGSLLTAVLDEISQTSRARVERMLALAGEPTPARALKLWKPEQPINPRTPLATVLYPPGHLDRWVEAHAEAPTVGRAWRLFQGLSKSGAAWRVALALLIAPIAMGIFYLASSRLNEGQVRKASLECQRAFEASASARWKNMTLSEVAMAQACAEQLPPERCVDQEGLVAAVALSDRLFRSTRSDYAVLSYYRFMPYKAIRLNLEDGRVFGMLEQDGCDGVESFVSNADWLAQGDEPAARQLIEKTARCLAQGGAQWQRNPALYTFLRHTDAWPATDDDTPKVRYRLRDLISQPEPVNTAEVRARLQAARPWGACQADRRAP